MTGSRFGACASALSSFVKYCSASGMILVRLGNNCRSIHPLRQRGAVHCQAQRSSQAGHALLEPGPGDCSRLAADHPDGSRLPPKGRIAALGRLPADFVQDIERYLARLGGESLLDEDAPERACKPSTIGNRRTCLRLAASAAVKQGVAPEDLCSLEDLVSPPVVRLILEHYLAKKGGEIVGFTIDMAERLYAIARVYVKAPKTQIRALERYCVKLRTQAPHRSNGEEHGRDPEIQEPGEPRPAQSAAWKTLRRGLGGAGRARSKPR